MLKMSMKKFHKIMCKGNEFREELYDNGGRQDDFKPDTSEHDRGAEKYFPI